MPCYPSIRPVAPVLQARIVQTMPCHACPAACSAGANHAMPAEQRSGPAPLLSCRSSSCSSSSCASRYLLSTDCSQASGPRVMPQPAKPRLQVHEWGDGGNLVIELCVKAHGTADASMPCHAITLLAATWHGCVLECGIAWCGMTHGMESHDMAVCYGAVHGMSYDSMACHAMPCQHSQPQWSSP